MYEKIIVAFGYEDRIAARAIAVARELKSEGGDIVAVHAIEPLPSTVRAYLPEDHDKIAQKSVTERIARCVGEADDVVTRIISGHPGEAVARFAKEQKADCIVVGTHEKNFADFLLGSTATRIVQRAPCSVHVIRP